MQSRKISTSPNPSYSFHGSNSSNSKDNGSGGRTYHIPNYATSYANENSRLISVTLDEDKGTKRAIVTIVLLFLLFFAIPVLLLVLNVTKSIKIPVIHEKGMDERGSWKNPYIKENATKTKKGWRQRGVYWDVPQGSEHCLAYGTREYSAKLQKTPFFTNWRDACQNTQAMIHNTLFESPTRCEKKWLFGAVTGYWVVNVGEPDCLPYWGSFVDMGCAAKGSGLRRLKSRLWGIKKGEDWMILCSTAPATIHGRYIKFPQSCDDQVSKVVCNGHTN